MFANQRNNRQEPIQSNTEDKLNRSIFVNYVTNIIKNAPTTNRAFVLSINGKWGEGKTSVKNLIAERLLYNKKSSNNMLLEFSSIEFQTQKELNKIFLDKVVNIVKGKNKNMEIIESIKENKGIILTILFLVLTIVGVIYPNVFVRLSSLIFSIIFIFRAQFRKITLNTLMEVLSKSYVKVDVVHRILYYDELKVYNVEDLKLKKYLETKCKYNKIIILIDNFDSLEPNQVKMLIQLINSKLNLPKFVFVLFYDKFIVSNCLTTNVYNGSEFIEKFVNIQLDLPMITDDILFTFLQGELQEKYRINIEYLNGFNCVKNYFSSLNKIYSFLDNFSVNYAIASKNMKYNKFDFNRNDFLFLEILRFFENDLYREIRQNKRLLTKHNLKIYIENKQVWPKLKTNIINNSEENIKELILDLFPYVAKEFDIKSCYNEDVLQKSRSVGCFDYFDYYFMYDLSENVIPENSLKKLENSLVNNEEFVTNFKTEFSISSDANIKYYASSLLYKLYKRRDNINIIGKTIARTEKEKELIKNIIWLYIYSDRNVSSKKYIIQIMLAYYDSKNDLDGIINSINELLEENNYFYSFYLLELLGLFKNVLLDIIFSKEFDRISEYKSLINQILFRHSEILLDSTGILNYLNIDNYNSRLQLNHIIAFVKNKLYIHSNNNIDFEIENFVRNYIKSGKFDILKDRLFKNYFKLIYSFVEYCVKKKIINNSIYLILNPNDLYPFTLKEVSEAFRENKISKKDKIYNVLLRSVKKL